MNGKICVKDPKIDTKVSNAFVSGTGWDVDLSSKVQKVMTMHPGAVFLGKINQYKTLYSITNLILCFQTSDVTWAPTPFQWPA